MNKVVIFVSFYGGVALGLLTQAIISILLTGNSIPQNPLGLLFIINTFILGIVTAIIVNQDG